MTPPSYITIDGNRLTLIARKHSKAKRIVLRYDARKNCLKLTLPRFIPYSQGLEFAASKESWIKAQIDLGNKPSFTPRLIADGTKITLFGQELTIKHVGGRGVEKIINNELHITGNKEFLARRARDFIIKEMLLLCKHKATIHAKKIDVKITSLALRDTNSRWGSCSSSGKISLCWRLAFAPIAVLDYVICHEVAHLKHHNHSKHFWREVEILCPEYKEAEKWLKKNGQSLLLNFNFLPEFFV